MNHRDRDGKPLSGYTPAPQASGNELVPLNHRDANGNPLPEYLAQAQPGLKEHAKRFLPTRTPPDTTQDAKDTKAGTNNNDTTTNTATPHEENTRKDSNTPHPADPLTVIVALAGLLTGWRRRGGWSIASVAIGACSRIELQSTKAAATVDTNANKDMCPSWEARVKSLDYENKTNPMQGEVGKKNGYSDTDGRIFISERTDEDTYVVHMYGSDGRILYLIYQRRLEDGSIHRIEVDGVERRMYETITYTNGTQDKSSVPVTIGSDNKIEPVSIITQGKPSSTDDSSFTGQKHAHAGAKEGAQRSLKELEDSKFYKTLSPATRHALRVVPAAAAVIVLMEGSKSVSEMESQGVPFEKAVEIEGACILIQLGLTAGLSAGGSALGGPFGAVVLASAGGLGSSYLADRYRKAQIEKYLQNNGH